MDIIIFITMLIVCYLTGKTIEKRHYKKIKEREVALFKKPYVSFQKNILDGNEVKNFKFVSGCVVLGCDHFKAFLASLKNLFGGNVSAYETVMDRARREALLRMREQGLQINADIIINTKMETVMLDPPGVKKHPKVAIIATGTAIRYDK